MYTKTPTYNIIYAYILSSKYAYLEVLVGGLAELAAGVLAHHQELPRLHLHSRSGLRVKTGLMTDKIGLITDTIGLITDNIRLITDREGSV